MLVDDSPVSRDYSWPVYEGGCAATPAILRASWNRKDLHYLSLCQTAVQTFRIPGHGNKPDLVPQTSCKHGYCPDKALLKIKPLQAFSFSHRRILSYASWLPTNWSEAADEVCVCVTATLGESRTGEVYPAPCSLRRV